MAIEIGGVCPLLQVFDMPKSVRFYRDYFGFQVTKSSPPLSESADDDHWVMLELNNTVIMLNTAYETHLRPPEPDAKRIAAHSDTILYFGCPDVEATYRQLRSLGLELKEPCVAPYGMKQLHVTDPDGYHLCFQWPA